MIETWMICTGGTVLAVGILAFLAIRALKRKKEALEAKKQIDDARRKARKEKDARDQDVADLKNRHAATNVANVAIVNELVEELDLDPVFEDDDDIVELDDVLDDEVIDPSDEIVITDVDTGEEYVEPERTLAESACPTAVIVDETPAFDPTPAPEVFESPSYAGYSSPEPSSYSSDHGSSSGSSFSSSSDSGCDGGCDG